MVDDACCSSALGARAWRGGGLRAFGANPPYVLIANASPFSAAQPDRMKVTVGKYVSIDLSQAQSAGRCGAGAELPRAIVIPEKKGACRVWLGE
jgi:hypothetical protein